MRMWMSDPQVMCGDHLKGEHVELHMFYGILKKKWKLGKFITNDLIEPLSMVQRHDELVEEMLGRGWKHTTPLIVDPKVLEYIGEDINHKINKENSLNLLTSRCEECKKNLILI